MMDFLTTSGAAYMVREVAPQEADYYGVPGSDAQLVGLDAVLGVGTLYGYFMATGTVPGRSVRVQGCGTRRGVRAVFVPAVLDEPTGTVPVDGYLFAGA